MTTQEAKTRKLEYITLLENRIRELRKSDNEADREILRDYVKQLQIAEQN